MLIMMKLRFDKHASLYAKPGIDGEHLDETGHLKIAEGIIQIVEEHLLPLI